MELGGIEPPSGDAKTRAFYMFRRCLFVGLVGYRSNLDVALTDVDNGSLHQLIGAIPERVDCLWWFPAQVVGNPDRWSKLIVPIKQP